MNKACRFFGTIVFSLLWIFTMYSEMRNDGQANTCGISSSEAQEQCILPNPEREGYLLQLLAPLLAPLSRARNTTVRSRTDDRLYWNANGHPNGGGWNSSVDVRRWRTITPELQGDTLAVCQPYHFMHTNMPRQCCYAIGGDDALGDQVSEGESDPNDSWCTRHPHLVQLREHSTLPIMAIGMLCFFVDRRIASRSIASRQGQKSTSPKLDRVVSGWTKWLESNHISVQARRMDLGRTLLMSCGFAIPLAGDFLIAYLTLDFVSRYRWLKREYARVAKAQAEVLAGQSVTRAECESEVWRNTVFESWWQKFRSGCILVLFALMFLVRAGTSAHLFLLPRDVCDHYNTPCYYYFQVAMQFSTRTTIPLVCFFHFTVCEIQLGVFKEMVAYIERIRKDDKELADMITASPLRHPESCGQREALACQWCGPTVLCLFYSIFIFGFNASALHIPVTFSASIVVPLGTVIIVSLSTGNLAMLMHWGLLLLSRSNSSHTQFVEATLGDRDSTKRDHVTASFLITSELESSGGIDAKDTITDPLLPIDPKKLLFLNLPHLDIAVEKDMHRFFKVWGLVNIREKEATLIMDDVISICVVVLLVNIVSSSTMLVFRFVSAIIQQPIFMLGSSIFVVVTQALINVLCWLLGIARAFSSCLTYTHVVSKDASYFKRRCTDLWLTPPGRGAVSADSRVQSALMIDQLRSNITSKNAITFLGTPITQTMVDRLIMYKVLFAVTLFGQWWYSVWRTES